MPRLLDRLKGATESTGGFADIEPGAYVLVVTGVEDHSGDSYVRLRWDVLAGERKGAYKDSQYPPSDVLSWKETAIGMYKHKLHMLADANPNRLHAIADDGGKFASIREAEEDRWDALVGCRFWAVVRRRLYTAGPNSKSPGADRHNMEVAAYLTQEQFDKGDYSASLLADRDQREKPTDAAQVPQEVTQVPETYGKPDVYDEDIPF